MTKADVFVDVQQSKPLVRSILVKIMVTDEVDRGITVGIGIHTSDCSQVTCTCNLETSVSIKFKGWETLVGLQHQTAGTSEEDAMKLGKPQKPGA